MAAFDGNIWFVEKRRGKIARMSPAGHIRDFAPRRPDRFGSIVAGGDGNLWFTKGGPHTRSVGSVR